MELGVVGDDLGSTRMQNEKDLVWSGEWCLVVAALGGVVWEVWSGVIWCGRVWFGEVLCGFVWSGVVLSDLVCLVWSCSVLGVAGWFCAVWCGPDWFASVWYFLGEFCLFLSGTLSIVSY